MLALETGWTPDVLAEIPTPFREACHWTLYARALAGPEGLPSTEVPRGASPDARLAAARLSVSLANLREELYPEGD